MSLGHSSNILEPKPVSSGGGGGGDGANLTYSRNASTVTVLSDTGTDAVLPAADGSNAGVMSAAQASALSQATSDVSTLISGLVATNGTVATNNTNRINDIALKANAADPSTTGVHTQSGGTVMTAAPMAANAIDITKGRNTKTIAANTTFTHSAAGIDGQSWGMELTVTTACVVTLPANHKSVSNNGAALASFYMPVGKRRIIFEKSGSTDILVYGEAQAVNNTAATGAPTVNDDATKGYGLGSLWVDTTNDNVYFLGDATTGAAVWRGPVGSGGGGSVAAGDVTGLTEFIQDAVNDLIVAGTNITKNYNDAGNTLTLSASGGGGSTPLFWISQDFISNAADDIDPFSVIALGSGSVAGLSGNAALNAGYPGVIEFRSSTAANSGVKLWTNSPLRMEVGFVYKNIWVPRELSTLNAHLGFNDSLAVTDPSNGVYWNLVNGVLTPRVLAQDSSTNVSGTSYSGAALANDAYIMTEIEILTTTTTRFRAVNAAGTEVVNEVVTAQIPNTINRELYAHVAFWTSATGTARAIAGCDKVAFGDLTTVTPLRTF